MDTLRERVTGLHEQAIRMRRDLHRIPETGFQEEKTSAYVAERLGELGLDVQTGIAVHGVVGLLNEDIMRLGIETHCRVALDLLG
jgi:amidohydrolase